MLVAQQRTCCLLFELLRLFVTPKTEMHGRLIIRPISDDGECEGSRWGVRYSGAWLHAVTLILEVSGWRKARTIRVNGVELASPSSRLGARNGRRWFTGSAPDKRSIRISEEDSSCLSSSF
jgi:hypothetical protein